MVFVVTLNWFLGFSYKEWFQLVFDLLFQIFEVVVVKGRGKEVYSKGFRVGIYWLVPNFLFLDQHIINYIKKFFFVYLFNAFFIYLFADKDPKPQQLLPWCFSKFFYTFDDRRHLRNRKGYDCQTFKFLSYSEMQI